jgi:polyisoprenoid-binding protein YceI
MRTKTIIIATAIAGTAFIGGRILYNKYRIVIPAIDINQSEIGWSCKSLSDTHEGKVKLSDAKLQFKNNKLIGGTFEADMKSITVTDIKDTESNIDLVEHLSNDDFFASSKFPKATFKITSVKNLSEKNYEITGIMQIKGKEKVITFPAELQEENGIRRLNAKVNLDRTQFGIEYGAEGKPGSEKDWFIYKEILLNVNVVVPEEKKS